MLVGKPVPEVLDMPYRACLLVLLLTWPLTLIAESPPNVVLLIGDDHGYSYFGFMGDDVVVTPAMDVLGEGGYTFTQGHTTAPYCRPSLLTLATGLHPVSYVQRQNEILDDRRMADPDYASLDDARLRAWLRIEQAAAMREFDTLPKRLGDAGYVSWQGGKWWEHSYENGHFDEGMTTGWNMDLFEGDGFFHQMMGADGTALGRTTMAPLFDFIERHRDTPMFIWYGPMLPHTPFDAPYSARKYYDHKDLSDTAKLYYSNVTWWDQGVDALMDRMERLGLLENTLFVYASDNGWEQAPDVSYATEANLATFGPLHGNGGAKGKGGVHDRSFRTPIIFYWKGRITGTMNDSSLVSTMDIVPTILDIVGVDIPDELPGLSLRPMLEGDEMTTRRELIGYTDNRRVETLPMGAPTEGYYVRTDRWHFLWYRDSDEYALFDVRRDPESNHDLAADFPHLVTRFKARIDRWRDEMGIIGRLVLH